MDFKRFFSYYKPYKGLFALDLSSAVVVAVLALLFPMMVRFITKTVLEGDLSQAVRPIAMTGVGMVMLVLAQMVCTYIYDYKGHAMGAMMERDMRGQLFSHYQRLSFSYYDEQLPGQMLSRLTNDLLELAELYHHAPEDLIIYITKFAGAFIILLGVNAQLTLVVFAFIPVMALFSLLVGKRLNKAYISNFDSIADVNAQVEENIQGIRVVQSFANEEMEIGKFAKANDAFLQSRKGIYRNESYFYTGIAAFVQLITISVVVFGGLSIVDASLDIADLITFMLYIGYLVEPIPHLARIVQQYQRGVAGFKRFTQLMDIIPDIADKEDALSFTHASGSVSFQNVGFKYQGQAVAVLNNVTFDVKPRECVAIVGISGAGKTTLCSLIPRFYEATTGEVLLDGKNVKDIKLRDLRSNIGVVQQEVYLFSGTVLENILYGKPGATREEAIQAAQKANAHDFILALEKGYDTQIGHNGVKLSGGQRQRLSIARAFLKDPAILILDEATSALDYQSEKVIQHSLEQLSKDRTTFVIAHRLSTIISAQRILVLSDKGIEEQGTHAQLMAMGGLYARLYSAR